ILLALREAVNGLEREYEEIVAQARACDVHTHRAVDALLRRVDQMLDFEIVRPKLLEAVGALANCEQGLNDKTRWLSRSCNRTSGITAKASETTHQALTTAHSEGSGRNFGSRRW